jgi:hypothetical protein
MSTDPGSTTPQPTPSLPPPASAAPAGAGGGITTVPLTSAVKKPTWFKKLFTGRTAEDQIVVYQHSTLFYWWPVWALGFVCCLVTLAGNRHMAIVPDGAIAVQKREVKLDDGTMVERDVIILKDKSHLATRKDADGKDAVVQPTIYVSEFRTLGTVFTFVLLLVIGITNITMRGLWSVLVLVVLVMLTIILAVAGMWEPIFARLGQMGVYINLGGYLLISTVVFVVWLANLLIFDRQTYVIFTPGQVRMRTEIGGGETVFDTSGMVVQKQRTDMFRHWILGFGSGDLLIHPLNQPHAIMLHNVLHVGLVVAEIEQMVKERVVVKSVPNSPNSVT